MVQGVPKFGYRCLRTTSTEQYIQSVGNWSLENGGSYEVSLWFRPSASQAGNLFALFNGETQVFALKVDSYLNVSVICASLNINLTVSQSWSLDVWTNIRCKISSSLCQIYSGSNLLAETSIVPSGIMATSARIGGAAGFIDEFVFRTSLTTSYQAQPLRGTLPIEAVGGFGTGSLGDVVINKNHTPCSACVLTEYRGTENCITVNHVNTGTLGEFAVGDEIMAIDRYTGNYDFVHITSISGATFYLDAIPKVTLTPNETFFIKVLHFNTLTLPASYKLWGMVANENKNNASGYVAFRCKGNCTINGSILTSGRGRAREDSSTMTHAQLVDKFLCDTGGGIFITCGGTFTASSTARIGGSWDGTPQVGDVVPRSNGLGGGAGYGGGAGSRPEAADSLGGVGYVGKGGDGFSPSLYGGTYGGAAGRSGESSSEQRGGYSGTSLILVAKTLSVDAAAICTGGGGGIAHDHSTGGGGTGFCYIACEGMV